MMKHISRLATFAATCGSVIATMGLLAPSPAPAQGTGELLQGRAAFTDWHADRPGLRRHIRAADLPAANLAASYSNGVRIARRSASEKPSVPPGFEISLFAEGLNEPRLIRAAPNGDIFVAESSSGRVRVLRPTDTGKPRSEVYASGLSAPFGISFYPPGPDPQWVYVANTGSVVRFPYRNGDLTARGAAEAQQDRGRPLGSSPNSRQRRGASSGPTSPNSQGRDVTMDEFSYIGVDVAKGSDVGVNVNVDVACGMNVAVSRGVAVSLGITVSLGMSEGVVDGVKVSGTSIVGVE
jgi:hypothetical protein